MFKNYYKDFFIYKKSYHYYILPAFVFYYDRYSIYDDNKMAPSWGLTIRWFHFMIGFQMQKIDE